MTLATDDLIAALAADATPVRRAAAPALRALAWVVVFGSMAAAVLVGTGRPTAMHSRMLYGWNWPELAATLVTALCGVLAAFNLAIPGRSRLWLLAPLPPFALWVLSTVWGLATMPGHRAVERTQESFTCFGFVVTVGAIVAATLIATLRPTRSIEPVRSAVAVGMGAGATAIFLLAFCHPFELSVMDFALHLAGLAVVVAGSWAARRALA